MRKRREAKARRLKMIAVRPTEQTQLVGPLPEPLPGPAGPMPELPVPELPKLTVSTVSALHRSPVHEQMVPLNPVTPICRNVCPLTVEHWLVWVLRRRLPHRRISISGQDVLSICPSATSNRQICYQETTCSVSSTCSRQQNCVLFFCYTDDIRLALKPRGGRFYSISQLVR